MKNDINLILNWTKEFPKNATSWREATDEIASVGIILKEGLIDFFGRKFVSNELETELNNRSKTPKEHNTKWVTFIEKYLKYANKQILNDIFRLYGHWFEGKRLFESNNQLNDDKKFPVKDLEFLTNKTMQFEFDNGTIMENLVAPKVSEMPISLKYWVDKSENFEDFIEKISETFTNLEIKITKSDIDKLKIHIEKYAKNA